jgi:hypothetical protein
VKKNSLVLIKRLSSHSATEDYVPGLKFGLMTLPYDYAIKGYISQNLRVGDSVCVKKVEEDNFIMYGYFVTAPIIEIYKDGFKTTNSVYSIEFLD